MDESKNVQLYNLIIAIKAISSLIEDLQHKREALLDEFKSIQLMDSKLTNNC